MHHECRVAAVRCRLVPFASRFSQPLSEKLDNLSNVYGWLLVTVIDFTTTQIGLEKLKNRIRQIRKIPRHLAQNINGGQSDLELRIAKLSDGSVEQFRHMGTASEFCLGARRPGLRGRWRQLTPRQICADE